MTSAAAPDSNATAYPIRPDHVKSEIVTSLPGNASSLYLPASLASVAYERQQRSPVLMTSTHQAPSRRLLATSNSGSIGGAMTSMQPQTATPHVCNFKLEVAQHPVQARASGWGSRSDTRRPVDPPPVVNLYVYLDGLDVTSCCKNTFILQATLHAAHPVTPSLTSPTTPTTPPQTSNLIGTTITSLNFMKQPPPGRAYFLFPDLSVRQEGTYRLVFSVFEICEDSGAVWRAEAVSDVLTVYSPKKFPGLDVSSALTREIASQGGKVRIRREARLRGRRPSSSVTAVSFVSLPTRPVTADSKDSLRPPLGSGSVVSKALLPDGYILPDGKRKLVDPSRTVESPMISPLSAPTQQQQHEYSYQAATYGPYASTTTVTSTPMYYPYHTSSAYNIFPPHVNTQQSYLPPPPSSTWAVPRNFSQHVMLPHVSQAQGQVPQYSYSSAPQYSMANAIDHATGQPRFTYVDAMMIPSQQRPPSDYSTSTLPSSSGSASSTSSGSTTGTSHHPSMSWPSRAMSASTQQLPLSMIPGQQAGVPMMQPLPSSMPMQVSVGTQMTMMQHQQQQPQQQQPQQQEQQHQQHSQRQQQSQPQPQPQQQSQSQSQQPQQQQQQQPVPSIPQHQTGQLGPNMGIVGAQYLYDEGFDE
ncbi:velvet factor-domain-containing protein [Lipomyces chichibuensis]|uniref:velvet factor-domain-containing protein n=1 Tax=Lipomyces chichibuensis TaxID=1546026 RepID=UPI00334328E6